MSSNEGWEEFVHDLPNTADITGIATRKRSIPQVENKNAALKCAAKQLTTKSVSHSENLK